MSRLQFDNPFKPNRVNGTTDFLPEWDVKTIGRGITDALSREIDKVREQPAPDNARKIHMLRGNAGYGKTHLFGRLQHEQRDQVQIVYISDPPDALRATSYVCWRLVETLFEPGGHPIPPLHLLLARLLRSSFAAYFEYLPPGLRTGCAALRQAIEADAQAVLAITSRVNTLAPYHALAYSFRKRFPDLPSAILRALVLGLTPAANDARAWLRGEAEQLPKERLVPLLLTEPSPSPGDVLRVVGTLLAQISVPLVLCLDQLDSLFVNKAVAFQELTVHLMGWLQSVPNLLLVLGCVEETWTQIAPQGAFAQRVTPHQLPLLQAAEARELVCRRVRAWKGFDEKQGHGGPFELAKVDEFAQKMPVSPRGLIERCSTVFDTWVGGGKVGKITNLDPGTIVSTSVRFLQDWKQRLAHTSQTIKAAANYQDAELWEGLEQALLIAQLGKYPPNGVKFEKYQTPALRATPADPKYSAEVHLLVGSERIPVVLAVSKKDGGVAFGAWEAALEVAIAKPVAGAVVVWPRSQLAVGRNAQAYLRYQKFLSDGTVRPFPLDVHEESFKHIECLRNLMRDAAAKEVIFDGKSLTPDDCRKLIVETGVLANLKLFEFLFSNWPAIAKALPVSAPPPATSPPPPVTPPEPQAAQPQPTAPATSTAPPPPPPRSGWAEEMLAKVVEKLRARSLPVRAAGFEVGPTFVRLKVAPRDDTDFGKVQRQADNLKLQLSLTRRPIIAAQPGFISIDVQRPDRQTVPLASVLPTRPANLKGQPAFPLGLDVEGKTTWLNLAEPATCHLLVAGTTGSGKSQLLKAMIAALAHHLPSQELKFILIDPKRVTFSLHGSSPYLDRSVVYDANGALPLLEECCEEMEARYVKLQSLGKEHIGELSGQHAVPRLVVVFDEFADLMSDKTSKGEMEGLLKRLGAKARAAGIHLILGTQRPEASVVIPLVRSNLPGRICLQVPSERDSKLLLDLPDAAYLLDKGDLFYRRGGDLIRLQSPFLANEELKSYLRVH